MSKRLRQAPAHGWALLEQFFLESGQQRRRFLFTLTGEGGTWRRWSTTLALSSMTHSTVSPFWNSMAFATAVGKLMYHCWGPFLRWMSWTFVGCPMLMRILSGI